VAELVYTSNPPSAKTGAGSDRERSTFQMLSYDQLCHGCAEVEVAAHIAIARAATKVIASLRRLVLRHLDPMRGVPYWLDGVADVLGFDGGAVRTARDPGDSAVGVEAVNGLGAQFEDLVGGQMVDLGADDEPELEGYERGARWRRPRSSGVRVRASR
jgi:hypothetical protein